MSSQRVRESLILGTAGHIDHGKSSLIKRLTGVDTDRLVEEKERGITIELGFADITTPRGYHYGIVDVPGHERFVRQMVAGATGVDLALLVIAANDGVMVQTHEHLAVLRLLGVTRFVVALTKVDLVDEEWIQFIEADIADLLAQENPPIVRVSNETGEGIDELISVLDTQAAEIYELKSKQIANDGVRFPVDRVFSIVGAGTVVTGTLWSGVLKIDDKLESVFSGKEYRIRSIQVHGEPTEEANRGNRVAVNLVGVTTAELARGDVLASAGFLHPSDTLNVEFEYLGFEYAQKDSSKTPKPLKSGTQVRVHHGTSETTATLHFFKEKMLNSGQKAFAQLRLDEPLVPKIGDRFVIRSVSPALTIGGGLILDPSASRRARIGESEFEFLAALRDKNFERAALLLLQVKQVPLNSQEVAYALGASRSEVADILNRSKAVSIRVGKTPYFIDADYYEELISTLPQALLALYEEHSEQPDFALATLKNRVDATLSTETFDALLEISLQKNPDIQRQGDRVSHKQAATSVEALDSEVAEKLMTLLASQGLSVMTPAELALELGQDKKVILRVLGTLLNEGKLIRLAGEFHFTLEAFNCAQEILRKTLAGATIQNPVLAADIRDALGTSRKYVIPLLEHFDRQGFTKRVGDGRILA